MAKNSINISIEAIAEEKIGIYIHVMVDDKIKETYLANVNVNNCDVKFPNIWKEIGELIHNHMKEKPNFYDFDHKK